MVLLGLLALGLAGAVTPLVWHVLLATSERQIDWGGLVRRWRRPPPQPAGPPIEEIAVRVRRLGDAFHHDPGRRRFAKYEAIRRSYDDALLEACRALEVDASFAALPPGPERDLGRDRVEFLLQEAGMVLRRWS